MFGEFVMRAQSEAEPFEPLLSGPREGDETEGSEKGGEGRETKRAHVTFFAVDPREGDETDEAERGGGSRQQMIFTAQEGPRPGDGTTPIRESPMGPPVRV
jgi:hypothetical protein